MLASLFQASFAVERIKLLWRPTARGKRMVVGTLSGTSTHPRFVYDGEDFAEALEKGFRGYPGLHIDQVHNGAALAIFQSRLPRRGRADYDTLLQVWGVTGEAQDPMWLLAATGGMLPTDMFEFAGLFKPQDGTRWYSELSGTSHFHGTSLFEAFGPGIRLDAVPDVDNQHDPFAVLVCYQGMRLAYIKRVHSESVCRGIKNGFHVTITVVRTFLRPIIQRDHDANSEKSVIVLIELVSPQTAGWKTSASRAYLPVQNTPLEPYQEESFLDGC